MIKERYLDISSCKKPKLNRSWKCNRFCPFGKNTTVGTNLPDIEQMIPNQISNIGDSMTICDCVSYMTTLYGIDYVQKNMGKYSKENNKKDN